MADVMKRAALITVMGIVVLLVTAGVVMAGAVITWNQTGVYVQLQPLSGEQVFEGLAFNAYYINATNTSYNITLYAVKYASNCPYDLVTFSLYDFYNGSLIGNYTLNVTVTGNVIKQIVSVPNNITVLYISVGGNTLGPYYISYMGIGVTLPEELRPYTPLIPLAFLIAFSARGKSKDVAFGLLAYSITVIPICAAFGYQNMLVPSLFSITAFLAFVALYVASHK